MTKIVYCEICNQEATIKSKKEILFCPFCGNSDDNLDFSEVDDFFDED